MKMVFVDTEFTGEHAFATLISVGLVTLQGHELYITLNDYNMDQITPWVKSNVIKKIDESKSINSHQAAMLVSDFLADYAGDSSVSIVSPGKTNDLLLLFQLFHVFHPERRFFHFGDCLPKYLNHRAHFDLDTLFIAAGIDPNIDREDYVGETDHTLKHHALFDAAIVRKCFLKLITRGELPHLAQLIY
ncbi:MAG: 3'-5' exoribonuclease [Euryarchaeota archaeon]|nr:3'-5' exoribonuclease [Euryarchaeota archaeon]